MLRRNFAYKRHWTFFSPVYDSKIKSSSARCSAAGKCQTQWQKQITQLQNKQNTTPKAENTTKWTSIRKLQESSLIGQKSVVSPGRQCCFQTWVPMNVQLLSFCFAFLVVFSILPLFCTSWPNVWEQLNKNIHCFAIIKEEKHFELLSFKDETPHNDIAGFSPCFLQFSVVFPPFLPISPPCHAASNALRLTTTTQEYRNPFLKPQLVSSKGKKTFCGLPTVWQTTGNN